MKSLKIGRFMLDSHGVLHGKISGLGIGSINVISEVVTGNNGKQYLKLIADPMSDAYEIGAAFPKEKDGLTYYSVSVDSPVLESPINAALFPDRDQENTLNLVWERTKPPRVSADAVLEAQQPRRFVAPVQAP